MLASPIVIIGEVGSGPARTYSPRKRNTAITKIVIIAASFEDVDTIKSRQTEKCAVYRFQQK